MSRLVLLSFFGGLFFTTSCETCTRCSCTYTETKIVQTVNGEEEVTEEKTTYVYNESDSSFFKEECVKKDEEETIRDAYDLFYEEEKSNLDNLNCICEDF